MTARRIVPAAALAGVPFAAGSALAASGLLHIRVPGLVLAGFAAVILAVIGAVNVAALTGPRPLARVTPALLPDRSAAHQARYEMDPEGLARLLGIDVPDGSSVTLSQRSTVSNRETVLRPDRRLVVCVTWPAGQGQ